MRKERPRRVMAKISDSDREFMINFIETSDNEELKKRAMAIIEHEKIGKIEPVASKIGMSNVFVYKTIARYNKIGARRLLTSNRSFTTNRVKNEIDFVVSARRQMKTSALQRETGLSWNTIYKIWKKYGVF